MRTPLNSTIFFIKMIIALLKTYQHLPDNFVTELKNYCSLMTSQVTLSLTFVDDMLDLSQYNEGVFSQSVSIFNPNKVLKMIEAIF